MLGPDRPLHKIMCGFEVMPSGGEMYFSQLYVTRYRYQEQRISRKIMKTTAYSLHFTSLASVVSQRFEDALHTSTQLLDKHLSAEAIV